MPRVPRSSVFLRIALVSATSVLFMAADCGDSGGPSTGTVIGVRVQSGVSNTVRVQVAVDGGSFGVAQNVAANGAYVDELEGNAGDNVEFLAVDVAGVYTSQGKTCQSTAAITAPSTGTPQQYGQANVLPGEAPGQSLRIQCSSGWEVND